MQAALSSKSVQRCGCLPRPARPQQMRARFSVYNTAAVATKSVSGRMAEMKAHKKWVAAVAWHGGCCTTWWLLMRSS